MTVEQMQVICFADTNMLSVELNGQDSVQTTGLNENVYIDVDRDGKVVGLTIEHAMEGTGKLDFSYETSAA